MAPSVAALTFLCGCGSNGPGSRPTPAPTPLAAPVWEAPVQVGDAGPGYPVGARGYQSGGPLGLAVDGAGNAFVGSGYAALADPANPSISRVEAWGNGYRLGQGWGSPVRLSEGTGLGNDWPNGLGLTPDGALFGWQATYPDLGPIGLRGFDLRAGWMPAGTLLSIERSGGVSFMTTDSLGVPAAVYVEGSRTLLVRHTGTLEGPETVFDTNSGYPTALVADGTGALAVVNQFGRLAFRLPGGRWSRTGLTDSRLFALALAGRPAGGFLLAWGVNANNLLEYAVASIDAAGNWGPVIPLGSFPLPEFDPLFGRRYDPQPRLAVGAAGAAVAWQAGSEINVARESGGAWEPLQTPPNEAVVGGLPRMGARLPFDLALDRSGTLLMAWTTARGLVSAQRGTGQAWSPTALLATGASDPLLAMNAGGTAFAAWRDGLRVMAARSPRR